MKKFLSLVLALVMTMSLVTVGAGAKDFDDNDSIDYDVAVAVMSDCGVIDGYSDGSFKPTATLTRGAAAKIICNMILGPTTAGALVADAAPFKDVPANSTFAGYIAYCSKEGIISGYADGTFKPGNTLTGYAFMKMLLGALGYDKANEGYEGANWSINVAKRALNISLDKGLTDDFNGVKPVTREEACLYAFNTLKATMVEYAGNSTITVGDIAISTNTKATEVAHTSGKDYTGASEGSDGTLQFCEKYFSDLKLDKAATDTYGRPANLWKIKTTEIGTYPKEADAVYTANTKLYQVNRDLGMSSSDTANFYYQINALKTYEKVGSTGQPVKLKYYQTSTSTKLADMDKLSTYVGNGVTVEFFYQDKTTDAQNVIVVIDEYLGEVKEVKSDDDGKYVTLKNNAAGSRKFYTEDFAKGDMVLFTIGDSATKIASMKAAEKLTGKLETVTGEGLATATYTIDGTTYSIHKGASIATCKAGDVVDFYLDSNGYIIKLVVTESSAAVENLVLFTDAKLNGWDVQAKAVYGSGKTATETIKDATVASDVSQYYIYSASTSSGKVKLNVMRDYVQYYGADLSPEGGYYFTKGSTKITDHDSSENYVQVNAKTAFVYITESGKTVKTYVGHNNAPSFTGADRFVALQKNGDKAALLVYVFADSANVTTKASDLIYAIADDYKLIKTTNANGDAIEYYDVKTLTGDVIKVDKNAYNYTEYTNYKNAGVIVYSSISKDDDGIAQTLVQKDGDQVYAYTAGSIVIEEVDGVLYFGGTGVGYSDKVTVYEIDKDCNVETIDVAGIDDTYVGFTYVKNDDGLMTTVVLKRG